MRIVYNENNYIRRKPVKVLLICSQIQLKKNYNLRLIFCVKGDKISSLNENIDSIVSTAKTHPFISLLLHVAASFV